VPRCREIGAALARSLLLALGLIAALPGIGAGAVLPPLPPLPIPSVNTAAPFVGAPATADPIRGVPRTPQNPFMAANGRSEIHNDGWQTDAFTWGGPLGRSPQTLSSMIDRDCASITLDQAGRLVSICVGASGPQLYMFDPVTLATLATFALPPRSPSDPNPNVFQDFTGGGYFYLDQHDRVIAATTTRHIYVISETAGAPGFVLTHDYDLSGVLTSAEQITSALPDQHGLLWFVARRDGVVGTLSFATGAIHVKRLGQGAEGEIENSFAVDQHGGVYIATNRKLYRFDARSSGTPRIRWQIAYPNSHQSKPGQVDDGTGTTPTVMAGGYVNITDNADPMDVMVYRTALRPTLVIRRHGHRVRVRVPRTVCRVPIFARGASADENSLIVAGRSMIAENNYGYQNPSATSGGNVTAAGFARVDLNANGRGCHLVWTNTTEHAPTVVSKLSLASGLIYTYTKDPGSSDPWYWTAIDFRTGRTVYRILAGSGLGYNNNYAGIALGPDGTEYLGTLGGLIALRG
jgi:hypothetical protein